MTMRGHEAWTEVMGNPYISVGNPENEETSGEPEYRRSWRYGLGPSGSEYVPVEGHPDHG